MCVCVRIICRRTFLYFTNINLQTDTFDLEGIDLGELEKVTIGHDGAGSGSDWYLEQIAVTEGDDATEQYIFPCGK